MTDPPYPTGPSNGRYVPMDLYLEDRKEMKAVLRDLAEEVRGMRREMDRDDGQEVAQEAAAVAVEQTRRTRRELTRDVLLSLLGGVVALVGALAFHLMTGGSL